MQIVPKEFDPVAFVIGSMGTNKGEIGGVDVAEHIPNIREALAIASDRLAAEGLPRIRVVTPSDPRAHDINQFVLRNIDQCDIGIADISGRSPNVFYELAYMHSLGIPVITFDDRKVQDANPIPWYAQTRYTNTVDSFSVQDLAEHLYVDLKYLFSTPTDPSVFHNPISNVYDGIALVDISAASGLAATYFNNFLRRVLSADRGPLAWTKEKPSALREVIIVRPNSIQQIETDRSVFTSIVSGQDNIDDGFSRHLTFKTYKNYIIDFPEAITALLISPRYIRISDSLKYNTSDGGRELLKIEKKWIEAFFDSLGQHVRSHRAPIFRDKVKSMSLSEIEKL